jgi:flagellar hook-associated protein FlgK
MSLIGALNVGKSALAVQQAAIQVTSNNIANAGNADYTRQMLGRSDARPADRPGLFVGTGVNLESISRQIDEALEGRLRGSVSDQEAADTTQQWLGESSRSSTNFPIRTSRPSSAPSSTRGRTSQTSRRTSACDRS